MRGITGLLVLFATLPLVNCWIGRTQTSWDCCKPACAWSNALRGNGISGSLKVCDKNDNPVSNPGSINSACSENAGNGYLCSIYAPTPVAEDLSYGFAVMNSSRTCCSCYELTWLDGPAAGKRMQVQKINSGGSVNDVIIVVPGGGVGPNPQGCDNQFGAGWGRQYGGVESREDCEALPDKLKPGCWWRFNWARGDVNNWTVDVRNITCPSVLTSASGCSAPPQ